MGKLKIYLVVFYSFAYNRWDKIKDFDNDLFLYREKFNDFSEKKIFIDVQVVTDFLMQILLFYYEQ